METLTLKALSYRGFHGYYQEERDEGNDFEVDLTFKAPLRRAGESDELADTIDYQKAEEIVSSVMHGPSVKLIETLAKSIGDNLFESLPQVHELTVAVRKLAPPLDTETAHSEISMTWQRS
ncbi:dihydroneopterin aldolase [Fodinibius halophilus]|uniref:7,8-dihydroneopterin aldolase n=1 Tax=Fodinibius halophilus TaxID=1736908 RepID=A0A6M1TFU0_9BACT|nr:dihydroneopterin aldolase [Fodinibius halophilus]NGP88992.1 dihydroneopterin aldolase [Fodinibius halophilus]